MIAVAIFARVPVPGRVKTRLAATVGADAATRIYRTLLTHTLEVAASLDAARFRASVYLEPSDTEEEFRAEFPAFSGAIVAQRGIDLGERLLAAVTAELANAASVLCVGSDCAELRRQHLEEAANALQRKAIVLGPAEDGGYWLLGTTHAFPELFRDIAWSSESVFSTTLQRANALGEEPDLLERLRDVDTEADAKLAGLL